MPRPCTVCQHPARGEIDHALVQGTAYRRISKDYSLTEAATRRHALAHLPAMLSKAQQVAEVAGADALLADVRDLHGRAVAILDKAEDADSWGAALGAIREARQCLELLGKLQGRIDDSPKIAVLIQSPEWMTVRATLLSALAPYPAARQATVEALSRVGA